MEQHLIISDIAARTGIEAHVLRYWEKELQLNIPRNELGHRYYLESHVDLFLKIHQLKEAGYQLKAIKKVIEQPKENKVVQMPISAIETMETQPALQPSKELQSGNNGKLEQFSKILEDAVGNALEKRGEAAMDRLIGDISDRIIKQMDYLFRLQDELEDERFKRLDETIRDYQRTRLESATGKHSRRLFRGRKSGNE